MAVLVMVTARRAVVLALVALAVLGGCAGSQYHYVGSSSTGTYFKVPSGWRVYPKAQVLSATGQLPRGAKSDRFLAEFDASPHPAAAHDFVTSAYPFGIARVHQLSPQEQDQYNLASLRNEVILVDNLVNQDPNSVQFLAQTKLLTTHAGLRGTKLEYTVHVGSTLFSIEQVGYVDSPTMNVWYLIVGCTATCFRHYAGDIHRVVDSWIVEGK